MSDKSPSSTATITVRLADEDRALLKSAVAAAAKIGAAAAGKPGKPAAGKPGKPAAEESEDFDAVDGDDGDGDGEDGDDGDGDGEYGGIGDGDGEDGDDGDGDDGEDDTPKAADVQAAMRAYAGASTKALAMKLLKEKGGVEALSKLKPAKFKAVIDACNVATKKAKAAKAKK